MITSVILQGFKGHLDTVVPLGRLTVLVGPNGSGKTSVLQALALASRLVNEEPEQVLRGDFDPQDLRHRPGTEPFALVLQCNEPRLPFWELKFEVAPAKKGGRQSLKAHWTYGPSSGEAMTDSTPFLDSVLPEMGVQLSELVGSAVFYHFDARRIAAAAYSAEVHPTVEVDGRNTAAVLSDLKLEHEELFARIESQLRKVVPRVERVRIRRVKIPVDRDRHEPRIGNKIFLDFKGAADVPAHGASEGTLVTLALLTALFSPNRPRLILLDDIDQSLHPQAQMELMRELKRLLEVFPDIQIVATTHSPYILDALDPSDVRVFAVREDGFVACRSLAEHPQAAQVRGSLTAGQLWSLDPEWRWVLARR